MSKFRYFGILAAATIVTGILAGCAPAAVHSPSPTHSSTHPSSKPTPTATVDPLAGWLTCDDTAAQFTYRYPSTWMFDKTSACVEQSRSILLTGSSGSATNVFRISISQASPATAPTAPPKGADSPFTVTAVQPVTTANSPKPLYLIAYSDDSVDKTNTAFLSLTNVSYTVGQTLPELNTNVATLDDGNATDVTIDLVPVTDLQRQYVAAYPLSDFTGNPEYPDLIKFLGSITFTH